MSGHAIDDERTAIKERIGELEAELAALRRALHPTVRYCEPCDAFVRTLVCPMCGADTVKAGPA